MFKNKIYNSLSSMNDIQLVQFDLLKQFIAVCEKHNLRYYLFGGSCLGAIRHKGFIPWDDDIDVIMPRPDFDKLLKLTNAFSHPYFLQSNHSEPRYCYPFAKLRNSNTTMMEWVFAPVKMNHGIWIDIFPLDGFTKRKITGKYWSIKPYTLWFRWYFSYLYSLRHPIRLSRYFFTDLLINIIAYLFLPFNINNFNTRLLEKSYRKIPIEEATLVGTYLTMYFNKEALPFDVFGNGANATFEGINVKVPADYDKYLTQIYGEYMTPPKEHKQKGHHLAKVVDPFKSYKEYI
jgi:lipopolysaccharide cholinephosphotransferase